MNENQRGFGIIEGILVVCLVIGIGLASWYVWNLNAKSHHAVTQSSPMVKAPMGWTIYQNAKLGLSFAYPKNWTFQNTSATSVSTASYHIGELTPNDKSTSIGITLARKADRTPAYTNMDEWQAYARKSNIKYSGLTAVKSNYASFSYVLDTAGATGLQYEVLNADNNLELLVLPTDTAQKTIIDQVVSTVRFGQ